MKKTFVIYASWQPYFDNLSDADAAKMIRAIYAYQISGEMPEQEWPQYPTFLMFKDTMDKDTESYNAKVERVNKAREQKSDKSHSDISMKTDSNQNNINSVTSDTYTDTYTDTKPKKKKYGQYKHVMLSDDDIEKLKSKHSESEIKAAVDYLDVYIEEKGYKTKNHKITLERWVFDAINKPKVNKPPDKPKDKIHFENERTYDFDELERRIIEKQNRRSAGG